ncbi:MAG: radical SAM protein [Candidatus Cloacimonetes bacterium]|nr:radical SAM protein [Candidatus Cloacimonadota bacterium]
MRETFCHRLWSEFFINSNGKVYTCCHHKPSKLGNIHINKLETIYNNEKILRLREQSLKGALKCFKNCNLLSEKELLVSKPNSLLVKSTQLNRLKIVFGEGCNINCRMCWQNSKSQKMLDFEMLKKQVNLSDFKLLDIQGGEPLFIKSSQKYFEYASSKEVKISILTNGTIMTEKIAKQLLKSSRSLKISLNAATKDIHEFVNRGSSWERVLNNIQLLKKIKDKNKPEFNIIGHMTIIYQNIHEIPLFIETFKKLGFDKIEFGYDFRVPFYLKLNPQKKKSIKDKISIALDKSEYGEKIELHRLQNLGLIL